MKLYGGQINNKKGGLKSALVGFWAITRKQSNVPYLLSPLMNGNNVVKSALVFILLWPLAGFGAEKTVSTSTIKIDLDMGAIKKCLKDSDHRKRREALEALSETGNRGKIELLKESLSDSDPLIREKSARLIGKSKDSSAFKTLSDALPGANNDSRLGIMEGLGDLGDKKASKPLAGLLTHEDRNTRWKAAEVLGKLKSDEGVGPLAKAALEDTDEYVKKAAIASLGRIGTKKAIAALIGIKTGGNEKPATWAGNVLKSLGK